MTRLEELQIDVGKVNGGLMLVNRSVLLRKLQHPQSGNVLATNLQRLHRELTGLLHESGLLKPMTKAGDAQ